MCTKTGRVPPARCTALAIVLQAELRLTALGNGEQFVGCASIQHEFHAKCISQRTNYRIYACCVGCLYAVPGKGRARVPLCQLMQDAVRQRGQLAPATHQVCLAGRATPQFGWASVIMTAVVLSPARLVRVWAGLGLWIFVPEPQLPRPAAPLLRRAAGAWHLLLLVYNLRQ